MVNVVIFFICCVRVDFKFKFLYFARCDRSFIRLAASFGDLFTIIF